MSTSTPPALDPTTTTAAPAADSPTAADRGDWDGVRFDVGVLDRIDRLEDGRTVVVFDRMSLVTEAGLRSGHDFQEEPVVYGNTDHPFSNENTRLRTYVLDSRGEVLRLANLRETCSDLEAPKPPRWEPVSVDQVVAEALWRDYTQVSLTFSSDGLVTRVRLSAAC